MEARRDKRNYKPYPTTGYLLIADATKFGLGILNKETMDVAKIEATAKYFHKISKRFFTAESVKGKISTVKNQPYYVQRGLGFSDYVRGYEYYVIDGQQYFLTKSNIKYALVNPVKRTIDFLNIKQFNRLYFAVYLNVFADAGYVSDKK